MGYIMCLEQTSATEKVKKGAREQNAEKMPNLSRAGQLAWSRYQGQRDTEMEEIYEMIWNDRKLYLIDLYNNMKWYEMIKS